jgi:hypothetical protein
VSSRSGPGLGGGFVGGREFVTGNDLPRIVAHRCIIEASTGKRIGGGRRDYRERPQIGVATMYMAHRGSKTFLSAHGEKLLCCPGSQYLHTAPAQPAVGPQLGHWPKLLPWHSEREQHAVFEKSFWVNRLSVTSTHGDCDVVAVAAAATCIRYFVLH